MYTTTDLNVSSFLITRLKTVPNIEWNDGGNKASFIFDVPADKAEKIIDDFFNGAVVVVCDFCDVQQRLKSQLFSKRHSK